MRLSDTLGLRNLDHGQVYYLSGPMSGIDEYNYPAFASGAEFLREAGFLVQSPHENPWPEGGAEMHAEELWAHMMVLCEKQMEKCDDIILLPGWYKSRGVTRELEWFRQHRPFFQSYFMLDGRFIVPMGREVQL